LKEDPSGGLASKACCPIEQAAEVAETTHK